MHHEGDPVWVAHQRAPNDWHLTRWAAEGYGVCPPACGLRAMGWVPWLWPLMPPSEGQCRNCLYIAALAERREPWAVEPGDPYPAGRGGARKTI